MITKLIIFGILCSTIIQAFPSPDEDSEEEEGGSHPTNAIDDDEEALPSHDVAPGDQKLPCDQQIGWIKNTTLGTKKEYDKYYEQLKAHNIDVKDFEEVKNQHEKINQMISDSFKRYTADLEKLRTVKTDVKAQYDICVKELKEFSFMNQNLSALTQSIRPKIVDFARQLGLPSDVVDDLDHTLGRIVNFMFIIDMGKKTWRDLYSMVEEADIKATEGVKLEEKYKFTEQGVEAVGKLEEWETIGHKDPWDKPDDKNEPSNDIPTDEEIKQKEKELEERERIERERLERERIAQEEKQRLEREERERLEREERERIERERIGFRPEAIHVGK